MPSTHIVDTSTNIEPVHYVWQVILNVYFPSVDQSSQSRVNGHSSKRAKHSKPGLSNVVDTNDRKASFAELVRLVVAGDNKLSRLVKFGNADVPNAPP